MDSTAERIHRTVSADATEIAGRVHGHGPPLVFVHGGLGNGEITWRFLVPFLTERFTCYCMSTRGRGLSADNPDHSLERLLQDITAFAESIGEPVGLVGLSSGAIMGLAASSRTAAISAVAAYEAVVLAAARDDTAQADPSPIFEAAAEGRLVDAVKIFFEESGLFNDDEIAALSASGAYELMAPNVPAGAQEFWEYHQALDESVLQQITVPVLLLHGSRTAAWYRDSAYYLAEHLTDARVVEIAGAGHMGPWLTPELVAEELVAFFTTARQPA